MHLAVLFTLAPAVMPAIFLRDERTAAHDENGWSKLQFAGRRGTIRRALAAPADSSNVVVVSAVRGLSANQRAHRSAGDGGIL